MTKETSDDVFSNITVHILVMEFFVFSINQDLAIAWVIYSCVYYGLYGRKCCCQRPGSIVLLDLGQMIDNVFIKRFSYNSVDPKIPRGCFIKSPRTGISPWYD